MVHQRLRFPNADLQHAFRTAGPECWKALHGQRLLLTGCTGFFGSWLLEVLTHACEEMDLRVEVWIASRDPHCFLKSRPRLNRPWLHPLAGDIRTVQLPDVEFTHVIHGAVSTNADFQRANPEELASTLVVGTINLLKQLELRPPSRFLLLSSGAVYGPQPTVLPALPESFLGGPDPLDPANAYGEGKRMAEQLCMLWGRRTGTGCTSARAFAFVGPGLPLDAHFAVGNFLRDALAHRDIQVHGDGSPVRSYLHTADLAAWIWRLLLDGRNGEAYNVGSDDPVTIAELAQEVASLAGVGVDIAGHPVVGPKKSYVPNISKAQTLGLQVTIPRMEALRRTFEWLRTTTHREQF